MPPPSSSSTQAHPAARQTPKSPNRVVAETELQWIFSEAELAHSPSIQDGMSLNEEREIRGKGINFIISVGIILKLPQLTLSTAAVFFQRFLMRASLKKSRNGIPKLHHYQSAATALFLATKVEESCRKMKELVQACCKVAQKNPNVVIDEQSKDFWKWRDCILDNEDVLLETLCFDLTIESPHRQLFEMLKWYKIEHNKPVRNSAWAWVTDTNNTQLCLLCGSRAIAAAGLYAACVLHKLTLPDHNNRPWWEAQNVTKSELLKAVNSMITHHEEMAAHSNGSGADSTREEGSGDQSIHAAVASQSDAQTSLDDTRQRTSNAVRSPRADDGRLSVHSTMSNKRGHPGEEANSKTEQAAEAKRFKTDHENPEAALIEADKPDRSASHDIKHEEEASRVKNGDQHALADVKAIEAAEGSEEGELDE